MSRDPLSGRSASVMLAWQVPGLPWRLRCSLPMGPPSWPHPRAHAPPGGEGSVHLPHLGGPLNPPAPGGGIFAPALPRGRLPTPTLLGVSQRPAQVSGPLGPQLHILCPVTQPYSALLRDTGTFRELVRTLK